MKDIRRQLGALYWGLKVKRVARLPPNETNARNILFWCPEAAAGPHLALLCSIADLLKKEGYRPLFIRCYRLFERCYPMEIEYFDYSTALIEKKKLCDLCAIQSTRFLEKFGFEIIDLRRLVGSDLVKEADASLNEQDGDFTQFSFRERLFGKAALHDLIIRNKLTQYDSLTEELRQGHRQIVRSALLAYLIVRRICERYELHSLIHYNEWTMAVAASWAAEDCNVRRFTVSNLLADRRYCNIFKGHLLFQRWAELESWERWKELPLPKTRVEMVADEVLCRMGGGRSASSHVHSPRKSTGEVSLNGISIDPLKKLIVAYTSSGHELLASTPLRESFRQTGFSFKNPFTSQIEWLGALVEFAGRRPDIQLIIRVHPSESGRFESEHHLKLRKYFENSPHCRFVWADEAISSYDLAEQASLVLVGWSTLATELALLGVPVLAAFCVTNPWPEGNFIHYSQTRQGYFERLDACLKSSDNPLSLANVVAAFRWFHFLFFQGAIDMRDVFPDRDSFFPLRSSSKTLSQNLRNIVEGGRSPSDQLKDRLSEERSELASREERTAVLSQLASIVSFCTAGDPKAEYGELQLSATCDSVQFRLSSKTVRRRSPMLARLCTLFESSRSHANILSTNHTVTA